MVDISLFIAVMTLVTTLTTATITVFKMIKHVECSSCCSLDTRPNSKGSDDEPPKSKSRSKPKTIQDSSTDTVDQLNILDIV